MELTYAVPHKKPELTPSAGAAGHKVQEILLTKDIYL